MDSFYTIVVVVAVAILILVLIGIGMMLQSQNNAVAFPLYATQCPDGWILDGSGCTLPTATHPNYPKKASIAAANIPNTLSTSSVYQGASKLYTMAGTHMNFNPVATTCQKRQWTTDYAVSWDGVSNYNKC